MLIAAVIIVHYVIVLGPDTQMLQSQRALFSWRAIVIIGLLGLTSVYVLNLTGLRKLWDADVGIKQKIFLPFVVGLLLGSIQSVYDLVTGASVEIAASMGLETIHIAFPFSIPVYIGGAILVCTIYYLIPISLVVYLVSTKILKGKAEGTVFWFIGILIALFEPLTNPGISVIQQVGAVAIPLSVFVLVFNLISILYIRKFGFIAAYFLRIGFYTVWHILYPLF
ncbi:hypothetical protein AKJ55_01745 [candidate division MSBL1 archaeon SCGC-AAA382M17]|uniref:Yip1 domain-containing protein n=1 Tax=candidate division MSBL1 archaeon SCGC-AAA382M17 TaxID=1698284 RepID=A0ABR5TJ75_9EURY|nr:hypothetical protein AKJ55_01745 [candidate division MSBL1 archaeon SCGC-AAA382M17]